MVVCKMIERCSNAVEQFYLELRLDSSAFLHKSGTIFPKYDMSIIDLIDYLSIYVHIDNIYIYIIMCI